MERKSQSLDPRVEIPKSNLGSVAEHSRLRILASSVLAMAGGALMVDGGLVNHSFLLSILNLAGGEASSLLDGVPGFALLLAISVVSMLIGLGGLTVVVGGIVIYARHITTGRLLVALGGGTGFVGLLISFGYTALTTGFTIAVSHSVYWVGLAIAIVARRIAKHA